jgi:NAD(P)-dependent dehydrogenase (short-subunit alcohol dehydrogenase family)
MVQAVGFDGDVCKQEDATRVLAATVQHFGKLDTLINGATGNFLVSPEDLMPKGFRTGTSMKYSYVIQRGKGPGWDRGIYVVSEQGAGVPHSAIPR